jgi:hypothetical protein
LYLRSAAPILGQVPPERYEPLPGLLELPAWLWRRTPRGARIALIASLLVVGVAAAVVIPATRQDSAAREAAAARERAELEERMVQRQLAEQRPRFGRTTAETRVAAAADLRAAIKADALRRVRAGALDGPILDVDCERFPRTVGEPAPEHDPSLRKGRYACVAVTARFEGGAFGHPYRALLDFQTGRYALCKVTPRIDIVKNPRVVTPRECGG